MPSLPTLEALDGSAFAAAVAAAVAVIACYYATRPSKKPFSNVPCAPGSWWDHLKLIGNPDFQPGLRKLITEAKNEFGQSSYWLLFSPVAAATDIRDVRKIVSATSDRVIPSFFVRHMNKVLGNFNMLVLRKAQWKHCRNIVSRAFTPKAVANYRSDMLQASKVLVQVLKEKVKEDQTRIFDFLHLMTMLTTDIFGLAAMTTDLECCRRLGLSPVAKAFKNMAEGMSKRLENPLNPIYSIYSIPVEINLAYAADKKMVRDFLKEIVSKRQQEIDQSLSENQILKRKDLLTHLLEAQMEEAASEDAEQDKEELFSDVLLSLMFGGFDTLSIALSYVIYELSRNPDVLRLCMEEIDGTPESAGIEKNPVEVYPYCYAVLLESLRLYPPGIGLARTLTHELTLQGGAVFPAGTYFYLSVWLIHRDPKYFPRPLEYLPERWVARKYDSRQWEPRPCSSNSKTENDGSFDKNGVPAANHEAFLAFSAGARNCVGQRYAQQEGVIILTTLIRHLTFEVEPADYKVEPVEMIVVQKPKDGMPVRVRERNVE